MNRLSQQHETYMTEALALAAKGRYTCDPNPMVGAIIVRDGQVLGRGYHQRAGEAHAEVNAINKVKDTKTLKKATLFVSLEPCAHIGKTAPCADLIIKKGIQKVVIGTRDPNPVVGGKGIEKLKNAGVDVIEAQGTLFDFSAQRFIFTPKVHFHATSIIVCSRATARHAWHAHADEKRPRRRVCLRRLDK